MVQHLAAGTYPSSRIIERGIVCGRHVGDGYQRGSELSQLLGRTMRRVHLFSFAGSLHWKGLAQIDEFKEWRRTPKN